MVVESWRGLVENQQIDVVVVEAGYYLRCKLRPIPESAFFDFGFIDIYSDVDVAVRLCRPVRVGAKQISLQNLRARFEQPRDTLFQGLAGMYSHGHGLFR